MARRQLASFSVIAFVASCCTFVLLVTPATSDGRIRVQACQPSGYPAPTCNNSCESSTIDSWTCYQDPMGLGSWVFGCQPFSGQCYRYSQRLLTCNGQALGESVGMCNVCTDGTRVTCNASAIRREVCTDPGCNSGCTTLYTIPYGKCVQYITPNNQLTYLLADQVQGKCFGLRVGYFNDTFCSSEVGQRFENPGECFSTSMNPLDEFVVSCGDHQSSNAPKASVAMVKRLAEALTKKKY